VASTCTNVLAGFRPFRPVRAGGHYPKPQVYSPFSVVEPSFRATKNQYGSRMGPVADTSPSRLLQRLRTGDRARSPMPPSTSTSVVPLPQRQPHPGWAKQPSRTIFVVLVSLKSIPKPFRRNPPRTFDCSHPLRSPRRARDPGPSLGDLSDPGIEVRRQLGPPPVRLRSPVIDLIQFLRRRDHDPRADRVLHARLQAAVDERLRPGRVPGDVADRSRDLLRRLRHRQPRIHEVAKDPEALVQGLGVRRVGVPGILGQGGRCGQCLAALRSPGIAALPRLSVVPVQRVGQYSAFRASTVNRLRTAGLSSWAWIELNGSDAVSATIVGDSLAGAAWFGLVPPPESPPSQPPADRAIVTARAREATFLSRFSMHRRSPCARRRSASAPSGCSSPRPSRSPRVHGLTRRHTTRHPRPPSRASEPLARGKQATGW
jgi:hypothetical protein